MKALPKPTSANVVTAKESFDPLPLPSLLPPSTAPPPSVANQSSLPPPPEISWKTDLSHRFHLFASLPPQFLIVLLLEFLNLLRQYGLRFVLYNYITNEFGLTDKEAGSMLGLKGLMECIFGLTGSILVDLVGVRMTSIIALGVAIVGRGLLAFGRTKTSIYMAFFLFSPAGESLLGAGLYRVAMKKLTTPRTRSLAFGIAYASANLSGAIADVMVDAVRKYDDVVIKGKVFTPTRMFVIFTWLVVLITFIVAVLFLKDETVIDEKDEPEEGELVPLDAKDSTPMLKCLGGVGGRYKVFPTRPATADIADRLRGDETMNRSRLDSNDITPDDDFVNEPEGDEKKKPRINPIRAILATIAWGFRQAFELFMLRQMWRAILFGFATFAIGMQWMSSEMVLTPMLERHYGESAPIYTIQSINLWGCLILPPFFQAFLAGWEHFEVLLPGIWIMALGPIAVILSPTMGGACIWQAVMTVGESIWSPRVVSWTASLAPAGKEGLFFAIATMRALIGPVADYAVGLLNAKYNPNCTNCRDQYGHFCDSPLHNETTGLYQCASEEAVCEALTSTVRMDCPSTCPQCPGYQSNPSALWFLIFLISLITPLVLWIALPFLRGTGGDLKDRCYGIFRCNLRRVMGIWGARPEASAAQRLAMYKKVRAHSTDTISNDVDLRELEML